MKKKIRRIIRIVTKCIMWVLFFTNIILASWNGDPAYLSIAFIFAVLLITYDIDDLEKLDEILEKGIK